MRLRVAGAFPEWSFLVLGWGLLVPAVTLRAEYQILHQFAPFTGPEEPMGAPTIAGNVIYGTTSSGWSTDYAGTIFSMKADGTGFQLLHAFAGNDGYLPYGSLTLSDSSLYGTTVGGGANNAGTIFRIDTDGTGFQVLHSFDSAADGSNPWGESLLQMGGVFYGTTRNGGAYGFGTLFRMNANGSGFQVLRSLNGGQDGGNPMGSLIVSNGQLYGLTNEGGSHGDGTLFSIAPDGTRFTVMHAFGDAPQDGTFPSGSLLQIGQYLYAMTATGGADNDGAIFRVNLDGSDFQLLHSFTYLPSETISGANPHGSLVASGDILYGMAGSSGNSAGSLFEVSTDGTGFTNLHIFGTSSDDGADPQDTPALSGSTLYGMTRLGISSQGTIFSYSLPEPSGVLTVLAGGSILIARRRRRFC